MQQARGNTTHYWNGGDVESNQEKDVESHQSKAHVDKNLAVNTSTQLPI